jgi:ribonuclease Z
MFLIDCGEGTQVQLRKHKIKFSKINHVFISHLHGDHFYGLIGLVSTFMLLNRTNDLHIYGPKGIKEVITMQLRLSNAWTNYRLYFHELESKESEVIYEDEKVLVKTIPLKHRIYTNGFLFMEKMGERKLNIDAAQNFEIDPVFYQKIKNGKDITLDDGRVIDNLQLTFEPEKPKSYAFCSDTIYDEELVNYVKGVNILYHESTFLESEAEKGVVTMHSTAKEAARIALKAKVEQLILGHYSTRYESIAMFKDEAETIFSNILLADDGVTFEF